MAHEGHERECSTEGGGMCSGRRCTALPESCWRWAVTLVVEIMYEYVAGFRPVICTLAGHTKRYAQPPRCSPLEEEGTKLVPCKPVEVLSDLLFEASLAWIKLLRTWSNHSRRKGPPISTKSVKHPNQLPGTPTTHAKNVHYFCLSPYR